MSNITLKDLETISGLIFGYKKNGRPRALYDVVKDFNGEEEHKSKKSKKRKKGKKKKHSDEGKSLGYFYKNAFDIRKMDF